MSGYTVRKLPARYTRHASTPQCERRFALFDPEGRILSFSWNAANLRRLCRQLNDAYDLGYVTGWLAKRGRPPKVSRAGEQAKAWMKQLPAADKG